MLPTFQHREVHGIVGFLRNTEHHLQAVFDLSFSFFTTSQQLLNTRTHTETMTTGNHRDGNAAVGFDLVGYLEEKLIFSDSLHRFDQIRGDGVGQSVSLLNFLLTATKQKLSDVTGWKMTRTIQFSFSDHRQHSHQSSYQRVLR